MGGLKLSILLLVAICFTGIHSLSREYEYTSTFAVFTSNYTVHWTIIDDEIFLAVQAETLGWVGFGIAETTSGSMPGADIFTAWVDDDGVAHLEDRHAVRKELPLLDECSDWELVAGEEDTENKITTIEVSRMLDTGDGQDRPIINPTAAQLARGVPIVTRIVAAYGLTDNVAYHESRRRATGLTLSQPEFIPEYQAKRDARPKRSGEYTVDYRISDYQIKTIRTEYVCQPYYAPTEDAYLVGVEVLLNPLTAKYVHHFGLLIHGSNDTYLYTHQGYAEGCYDSPVRPGYEWTLWGWGPGTHAMVLPENVGFKVGADSDIVGFSLQIHYDNPNHDVVPYLDNVGVRITYTKEEMEFAAGTLSIGDVRVSAYDIPPGEEHVHYEFECVSQCTSTFPHSINVFAVWTHAHQIASQIFTTHHKPGADLDDFNEIGRVDFWDFYFQQTTPMLEDYIIEPGDRLNMHCYFDSTTRTQPTIFGSESTDEMCLQILYYYPALPQIYFCGYYRAEEVGSLENNTVCGREFWLDVENPVVADMEGLDEKWFGVATEMCSTSDGKNIRALSFLSYIIYIVIYIVVVLCSFE